MYSFIFSIFVLVFGYFIYGKYISKVFGVDNKRSTPVTLHPDGVDFVRLPVWKVFLIQFLNIAGLGPIFGAIMGIQYGPAAFLWIALGTIFAGGVHDFFSGAISLRKDGKSFPEIVGEELGMTVKQVMRCFSVVLLIMVGAVFVINPAQLLDLLTNSNPDAWFLSTEFWILIIFVYYILATLLPVDKIIGNLYPVFGFTLLFMAVGVLVAMIGSSIADIPEFTSGLHNRYPNPEENKIFPLMFVSIACGAISGFHATQSPMMARCLCNEKYLRPVFYGSMVAEGIVALIWAAAAIAFFHGNFGDLSAYLAEVKSAAPLVNEISITWLGAFGGALAIIGVVAAPITSGDTALRSARLIIADIFKIKQSTIVRRLLVSVPIFIITYIVMKIDYTVLWRYFGWSNQTLAVFMLWTICAYLARQKKNYFIAMIPAIFMTMVSVSYIVYAPEGFSFDNRLAEIIAQKLNDISITQIDYYISLVIAAIVTTVVTFTFFKKIQKRNIND